MSVAIYLLPRPQTRHEGLANMGGRLLVYLVQSLELSIGGDGCVIAVRTNEYTAKVTLRLIPLDCSSSSGFPHHREQLPINSFSEKTDRGIPDIRMQFTQPYFYHINGAPDALPYDLIWIFPGFK